MARDIDSLLRQQAALADFGSFAFGETDLMVILNVAARICAESLKVFHCKICRYRPEHDDLLIEAGYGWHPGVVGKVVSQADESSPQGRAFVTGEPVIVHNLHEANDYLAPPFYAEHGIISTVDVLIRARGGPPFGVLEIDNATPHQYDEHDIAFLTGFANVLAEAVATRDRNEILRNALEEMRLLVEEKTRLVAQRDTLAEELQHRVRNNLQLVKSMLQSQLRRSTDVASQRGIRGIIQRVSALGQVYDHLLGVGMSGRVDFAAYLRLLCDELPGLQPVPPFSITLSLRSDELMLELDTVTVLGLVVSELVSNSYEHAFPTQGGSIMVDATNDAAAGCAVVTIRDDGVGFTPNGEEKRHGVGLVRRMVTQLDGTMDVDGTNGTLWTLRFPLAAARPNLVAAL